MNFDFSDDLNMLREQARKFLAARCSRQVVRKVFEGGAGYDPELWGEIARMGWLGTAIPDAYGGSGVGYDGLCVLAEEVGPIRLGADKNRPRPYRCERLKSTRKLDHF
jgi:acyl-CoA dehydrogenase